MNFDSLFRGDLVTSTLAWVGVWETLRFGCKYALRNHPNKDIRTKGPAYVVSSVHALYACYKGYGHLSALMGAPDAVQLRNPEPASEWFKPAMECIFTARAFTGYMVSDLAHVLLKFPRLGGADTVAHHFAFLTATVTAQVYKLMPFPFAWSLSTELSTIFLNQRWYLLKMGLEQSSITHYNNLAFASTFFFTRVVMYGAGIIRMWKQLIASEDKDAPIVALATVMTGGLLLNLLWFKSIIAIALGKRTKPKQ